LFNQPISSPFGLARVGYVVKRYPRYSETFIVNEILAHEAAGLPIEIFSIRPPVDSHFQDLISQVRAPVHYVSSSVSSGTAKASEFWRQIADAVGRHPMIGNRLSSMLQLHASDVMAAVTLADQALDSGITHFHAHFATSAADVAWLAHQLTGIPFTLTAHAKDIFHDEVDQVALGRKLSAAKATITVSDFNVDYLKQKLGPAADRVVRIYNGLNLNCFQFDDPQDRPPTILAVGRLIEKKGFDVLVKACAILADRDLEYQCSIIGDGPLLTDLRSQCSRLDLDSRIEFLGPQPQDVVKTALRQAAVFAAPCVEGSDGNRDGMPTVLLESMALGTPSVSTPVTGIPEILIDGQTGLLVPQRDPLALADALHRLLLNPKLRIRLADAARGRIEEHFDIRRNTEIQRRIFGLSEEIGENAIPESILAGVV